MKRCEGCEHSKGSPALPLGAGARHSDLPSSFWLPVAFQLGDSGRAFRHGAAQRAEPVPCRDGASVPKVTERHFAVPRHPSWWGSSRAHSVVLPGDRI